MYDSPSLLLWPLPSVAACCSRAEGYLSLLGACGKLIGKDLAAGGQLVMTPEAWEQFADSGAAPAPGPAADGGGDRATVNDDAGSGRDSNGEQRGEATSVTPAPGSPPPTAALHGPAGRPEQGGSGTGDELGQLEEKQGDLEQQGTPPPAPSAGGVVGGSPSIPAPQPAPASPAVAGPPPPQPLVEGAAAPTVSEAKAPSSDAGTVAALAAPSQAPGPAPESEDGTSSNAAAPAAMAGVLAAVLGAAALLAAL